MEKTKMVGIPAQDANANAGHGFRLISLETLKAGAYTLEGMRKGPSGASETFTKAFGIVAKASGKSLSRKALRTALGLSENQQETDLILFGSDSAGNVAPVFSTRPPAVSGAREGKALALASSPDSGMVGGAVVVVELTPAEWAAMAEFCEEVATDSALAGLALKAQGVKSLSDGRLGKAQEQAKAIGEAVRLYLSGLKA